MKYRRRRDAQHNAHFAERNESCGPCNGRGHLPSCHPASPPRGCCVRRPPAKAQAQGRAPYPPLPLRKHHGSRKNDGQTGGRCLHRAALARNVRCQPSQGSRRLSWLQITSKQTAAGCSSKHNVVMSRRTHPKHDTAPVSLYNRHTITFCSVSDHKNCGQKNDCQTSRC